MLSRLLAALLCATAACYPQMVSSQAKGAARAQIAMLSTDGGCAAGIIMGSDGTLVYIATAAHVIPDLSARPLPGVVVHLDGGIDRNGTFLATVDLPGKGDLAMVTIPRDPTVNTFLGGLDFALLSPDMSTPKDSRVYSVGCSGGVHWSTGTNETFRSGGANLVFDSGVTEGQSGGGLFNSGWELIGMPFIADGTRAQAHPISGIIERVKAWKWPVALKQRATTNRVADSDTVAQEARAVTLEERAQSLLGRSDSDSNVIAAYAMVGSKLATPRQTRVVRQAWNAMQRVGFVRHVANYRFGSDSNDFSDEPFHGERVTFSSAVSDRGVSLRFNTTTAVVWDAKGEKPRIQIAEPAANIAVGPDGAIATFGLSNELVLWASENGRKLENFTAANPVVAAAFNANGRWLAIESSDHTVSLWNRSQSQAAARFRSPGGPHRLRICGDGTLAATIGPDGDVKIYSREKDAVIAELAADSSFGDLQFMPGCAQMVIADRAGAVRIASTKDGSEIAKIQSGQSDFAALSPDGMSIVTIPDLKVAYAPFSLRFVSLIDQREVSWLVENGSGFNGGAFTTDGKGFLLSTQDQSGAGSIGFADLYALDLAGREDEVRFAGSKITTIAFDAGDHIEIATAVGNERVRGSNRSSNCQDSCRETTSPNGKWRLLADEDGFELENISTGTKARFSSSQFYDGFFEHPSAMAISPDGATVAIAVSHATGVFKIGKLTAENRDLQPSVKITGDTTALAFSPNGELLALGTIDGTVQAVRTPGGEDLAVANAGAAITAVVIADDGRFAAADVWGRARVWNASIDSMRKRLCDSLGSNLSEEEWKADLYLNVQPPQLTCENWPRR